MKADVKTKPPIIDKEGNEYSSYLEYVCATGIAGQAAVLEAQLKAGAPLIYQDEHGNDVQENPDGTIIILEKKET